MEEKNEIFNQEVTADTPAEQPETAAEPVSEVKTIEPLPTAEPAPQENSDIPQTAPVQEEPVNSQQPEQTQFSNPAPNQPQGNVPPPFVNAPPPQNPMYGHDGFNGYNRANIPPEPPFDNGYISMPEPEPQPEKEDKLAYRLISVLIAVSIVVSVVGIVYDVVNSRNVIRNFGGNSGNVVLYSEKKPENTKKTENFKDENGKYTTEGIAELVRPSIVEIYTYSDPAHTDLEGTGSGVVISDDGYIVTNAHVLDEKGYHAINTVDDKTYSAEVIGRDVKTDIAVIKVNAKNLVPAVLGDSDEAVVGEEVVAIGNPANLSSTVTNGIISAIDRKIRSDSSGFQMTCIQTNADISPGNSGGALVNMYGQVIGITSSKYVSSSYEGLGFAITINEAKPIIEELMNNGFIAGRFRVGITLIDMATASKRAMIESTIKMELPKNFKGIYISDIAKDCDIANTKLKKGDFITEIDGTKVSTYDEFYDAISAKYKAGDKVPAKCAHLEKSGASYYEIEFKLMEDTSGNY